MKIRDIFNFLKYRVKFSNFFKYFNKYYINGKLFEKIFGILQMSFQII